MSEYMDLNIAQKKLKNGDYLSTFGFIQDVRMIWIKAFKYLKDNKEDIKIAKDLSSAFELMVKENLENLPFKDSKATEPTPSQLELQSTLQKYQNELAKKLIKDQNAGGRKRVDSTVRQQRAS